MLEAAKKTKLTKMRYFENPFNDFDGSNVEINRNKILQLIKSYVNRILQQEHFSDGDIYVGKLTIHCYLLISLIRIVFRKTPLGTSGIAYMFLKLHKSEIGKEFPKALQNAKTLIELSKQKLSKKEQDKASFLCGNAGIFAVSSIINYELKNMSDFNQDKQQFLAGYNVCKNIVYNRYGSDEILFGRAGYLSAVYWINQNVQGTDKIVNIINDLCHVTIESGIQYSRKHKLSFPLMWECYNEKYLGAAHGICAILHMILESPLFCGDFSQFNEQQTLVKTCIDLYLETQSNDGNFPCVLEDCNKPEHKLVHWCHGAPGSVYLFAKAYLIFKEEKYLNAVIKSGDLIWKKGLLRKGLGICHGVAGNGYVFLLLFRLTNDPKHLYRANCFAEFLTNETFLREARSPDRPLSLYEGISGTICFLVDLLEPDKASFPFMDVFDCKI